MATLTEGQIGFCQKMPYTSFGVLSMVPVVKKGIRTAAVDQFFRIYHDPEVLATWNAATVMVTVGHEYLHLTQNHFKRARAFMPPAATDEMWNLWNWATDAEVNDILVDCGFTLPDNWVTSAKLGLPLGRSAEFYYAELFRKAEEKRQEQERQRKEQERRRQEERERERERQEQQEQEDQDDQQPDESEEDDEDDHAGNQSEEQANSGSDDASDEGSAGEPGEAESGSGPADSGDSDEGEGDQPSGPGEPGDDGECDGDADHDDGDAGADSESVGEGDGDDAGYDADGQDGQSSGGDDASDGADEGSPGEPGGRGRGSKRSDHRGSKNASGTDDEDAQSEQGSDSEGERASGGGESADDVDFPDFGESGSCSDGRPRPWEDPPPSEADAQGNGPDGEPIPRGVEPWEQDVIREQMAESAMRMVGKLPGSMRECVEKILRPQMDPKRLLMRSVRSHTDAILKGGDGRYSYRRPSRRQSSDGFIRPSTFRTVCRIVVCIDCSGSMQQSDLGLAVGLVANVLSGLNLRDGIEVVCADVAIKTCERVFDPSKIVAHGRGGTEIDRVLVEIVTKQKENREPPIGLIVAITDGCTAYPKQPIGVPCVVCLTRPELSYYPVPKWMDKVNLYRGY